MYYTIKLDEEDIEALIDLSGYNFREIEDVYDDDVEEMIKVVIGNL